MGWDGVIRPRWSAIQQILEAPDCQIALRIGGSTIEPQAGHGKVGPAPSVTNRSKAFGSMLLWTRPRRSSGRRSTFRTSSESATVLVCAEKLWPPWAQLTRGILVANGSRGHPPGPADAGR